MKPYYTDDAVTIYHGDCREVLPDLGVECDAIFDPPYGVGIPYSEHYNDARDIYWDWFLPALAVIRAHSRRMVFTHRIEALRHVTGWDWVGVWNKPGSFASRIGNSMILPHWEPLFMFGIHDEGVNGAYRSDVFTFNPQPAGNNGNIGRAKWQGALGAHPCPKPHELMGVLIQTFNAEGRTVLDPFMGSGTTLVAAKNLGRNAIGIEIEERYCEIAARRCAQECLAL